MPDILRARHVGVRHAGARRDAVRDISLTVQAGERIALLGPSGSGKTSLALALAGAIPSILPGALAGRIEWPGRTPGPDGLMAGTGACAIVMQNSEAQIVALGVADEIAFALENRGLPASEIDARIAEALSRPPALGLAPQDRTLPLSSGWRQRLSLAAAMAEQADLLIIDEPVAHLDEQAAQDAIAAVQAACAGGAAVVIIEHRADHAAALAERVVVLDHAGRLVVDGAAGRVFAHIAAGHDRRDAHEVHSHGLRLPALYDLAGALLRAGLIADIPANLDEASLVARMSGQPQARTIAAEHFGFARARPPAQGGELLSIDGASLKRGGRTILREMRLSLAAGEIAGLAGPNGAGKTSLGLLAAGGLAPHAGAVRAAGARRPIFLPQNPAPLFASATLRQEAERRGLAWPDFAAQLAALGVEPDPARHPLAHSHGEMRRIGLALALADARAGLVVLDEPTAGLDGNGLATLTQALEMLALRGCAALVISHDLDWLGAAAHRIVVLKEGRIAADAPAPTILAGVLSGRIPLAAPPRARLAARLGWSFPDGC